MKLLRLTPSLPVFALRLYPQTQVSSLLSHLPSLSAYQALQQLHLLPVHLPLQPAQRHQHPTLSQQPPSPTPRQSPPAAQPQLLPTLLLFPRSASQPIPQLHLPVALLLPALRLKVSAWFLPPRLQVLRVRVRVRVPLVPRRLSARRLVLATMEQHNPRHHHHRRHRRSLVLLAGSRLARLASSSPSSLVWLLYCCRYFRPWALYNMGKAYSLICL